MPFLVDMSCRDQRPKAVVGAACDEASVTASLCHTMLLLSIELKLQPEFDPIMIKVVFGAMFMLFID